MQTAAVWLYFLGFTAPKLRNIKGTVYLSYSSYMCRTEYNADFYPEFFTSILLLIIAKRSAAQHGNTLRWHGVSTVLLTSAVLLLSHIGWWIQLAYPTRYFVKNVSISRVFILLQFLNIMANFFIYSLTVQSFRVFLKLKITRFISLLRPRQGTNTRQAAVPREELHLRLCTLAYLLQTKIIQIYRILRQDKMKSSFHQ